MNSTSTGSQAPPPPAAGPATPLRGAGVALALLLLMNLFNYIDRYVLAAVEPEIRLHLLAADDLNPRAKTGLLATVFLVSYMVMAPIFGRLAERRSRWLLIAVGVILWSAASGASGLAATFLMLLLTRCFVGVGEAAYGPVAPAILSDLYPAAIRGRILSWFYAAIPVGSALGYALGGVVAKLDPSRESWRWAFFMVVPPGVLLGLWAIFMRDPRPVPVVSPSTAPHRSRWQDYLTLFRNRSYVLNTLGMTAMTFAIGAISFWMPDFLEHRQAKPILGIEPRVVLGGLTVLAGLLGTLSGGAAGDRLRKRWPGSYFLVSAAGMLVCFPCTLLFIFTPFPAAWVFIFLAEFFLFFNTGPTNTILANVTHPSIRATGFGLNILLIHLLGDAISPPLIGRIADRTNMATAFVVMSAFILLAGGFWLWGAKHLDADSRAAEEM
jgi:MFS transporter, Spinster family, sphingosine-1-phosphate transporter